ncbi:hypothetical protein N824_01185 [Pedobacter sp. V48]|nr:hypothetical protein N824_01185 [Pedobacter sp. V48]
MNQKNIMLILSILIFFIVEGCNNKYPFKVPYNMASGYVIGRERCNEDVSKDYWLIEIVSSASAIQQYGDTLTLNGVKYTNAIKATGLSESLKKVGEKVAIDFNIQGTATLTMGCSVDTPKRYQLKVAEVINSGRASF